MPDASQRLHEIFSQKKDSVPEIGQPAASRLLHPGHGGTPSMWLRADHEVLYSSSPVPEQQEIVEAQPPSTVFEGFVRAFNLSDPEDQAQCERVWDLVGKQYAHVTQCVTEFSQATGSFVMLLVWYEKHTEFPSDFGKRAIRSDTGQISFIRPWVER